MPNDAERGKSGGKPFRKVESEMNTIFESLEHAANRLNDTADAANDLIRDANTRLGAIGAGVAFSSDRCVLREVNHSQYNEAEDREDPAGYTSTVLCYGKIFGTWQLGVDEQHYVPGTSGQPDDHDLAGSDTAPLLNADREFRIEAAAKLPEFLKEYTAHLQRLADKLSRPE